MKRLRRTRAENRARDKAAYTDVFQKGDWFSSAIDTGTGKRAEGSRIEIDRDVERKVEKSTKDEPESKVKNSRKGDNANARELRKQPNSNDIGSERERRKRANRNCVSILQALLIAAVAWRSTSCYQSFSGMNNYLKDHTR